MKLPGKDVVTLFLTLSSKQPGFFGATSQNYPIHGGEAAC